MRIKELFPEKPVFLLGHSMGSFVVRNVLTKYGTDYAGTVIMGTSGKNPMARLAIPIASIIKWVKGGTYRSRFLKNAGFSGFHSRFPDDSSENAWITGDKTHRDRYDADPLCTFTFTVSAYLDLYRMLIAVSSEKWARTLPKDLPVLLISGADDPLGKYGEGVQQVYHWLKGAGMQDVSIELVEKGRQDVYKRQSMCRANHKRCELNSSNNEKNKKTAPFCNRITFIISIHKKLSDMPKIRKDLPLIYNAATGQKNFSGI